ncbi:MAG: threonine synthase [Thaumarchaeota archaeon]|nr:threonine synthase [Candidatus Calditenuaceae archaeon]MDW8186812.1 threonine synthase [Nitrososphaerota archaeon]
MGELNAAVSLVCRECGKDHGHVFAYTCVECLGALEASIDLGSLEVSRSNIEQRNRDMRRYREFLPILRDENIVSIGTGYTPLIRVDSLARAIGVRRLYVKNDTVNPTFSFKDRPSSVAVSKAKEFGLGVVGCASTGNLAGATAAHAAAAGLRSVVMMPSFVEDAKVVQASVYGATVVLIDGTYDDVNRLAALVADRFNIGVVNVNLRPYYVEGSKTMGLEIVEQLGWRTPDRIVVPSASGALLSAIYKGIREAEEAGLLDDADVAMTCAQPEGCSPITTAYRKGLDRVIPVHSPQTIVRSLAIGDPGDGLQALRVIRSSGGTAGAVSDVEALEAVNLLAKETGVFAEPGGAISVAVLKRLVEEGEVGRDEEVVCCVTGAGFKTLDVIPKGEGHIRVLPSFAALSRELSRVLS